MKTAFDIVRGLLCLVNPDLSAGRCWNCVYNCEDPKTARTKILRDANNYLRYTDGPAKPKHQKKEGDRK